MSDGSRGCKKISEYIADLTSIPNNKKLGTLQGKVVADLATGDLCVAREALRQGASLCYVIGEGPSQSQPVDERIVYVKGQPWDAPLKGIDVAFFDTRSIKGFDPVRGVTLLMAHLHSALNSGGIIFAILQSGYVGQDWDVFNSIVLTPQGPMPTSPFLYESVLKNYTVRLLDHPPQQVPGVTTRFFRLSRKKPTLLLIFAQSESGKTSLARDFKIFDQHAHVSNDYIFMEIVRLKASGDTALLPMSIAGIVSSGGGENCGKFFRTIEMDSELFGAYLGLVKTLIPEGKQMVTIDLDLRQESQFDVAKNFFTEAGFSVWVVTR